jgi:PAS domain S-box-containing protein
MQALDLLRQQELDVPFILISGAIGEQTAVEAIKRGADDFLIKDRLGHLGSAVTQALSNKRVRDERKRTEQERTKLLHDSQLLASMEDSAVVTSVDGIVTYWNAGAMQLFGWTAEEMLGRPWINRFPESSRQLMASRFQDRLAGGERLGEFLDWRKDGTRVWIDVRVTRIVDEAGKVEGVLTISRDITARKKSEDEMRQQQMLLSNAERIANVGSWEMDLETNQLKWSDQTYRIFGLQPDEFAGTFGSFHSQIHPDDRERVLATVAAADAGNNAIDQEYRIRHPDGEERVLHERGEVTFDASGKAIRRFGVVIDITQRERYVAALRKSEERFQLAVNGSTAGLWDADIQARDVYFSPRFKELLGYLDSEFPNSVEAFSAALHPEDHDRVHFALNEAIEGRQP